MRLAVDTLSVVGLSKTYIRKQIFSTNKIAAVKALCDVSFSMSYGFYGLLGPNGSGKSTLINIIVGSIAADSGSVSWNDQPALSLGMQFRRVLGYMPQQQTLYNSYTGRRFLAYIAALKEIPKSMVEQKVMDAAKTVNLEDELDKRLSAFSGGMKQRLLLAASIMYDPHLLILDEPTAGLDPKERARLRDALSAISKNCIVIVATHVVSDIERVADQVLILKQGRLFDMAPPETLVCKYASGEDLEAVYLSIFGDGD